jgi:hypothetical protein
MSDFAFDGFKPALFRNCHCLISNVYALARVRLTIHFDAASDVISFTLPKKAIELQRNNYSEHMTADFQFSDAGVIDLYSLRNKQCPCLSGAFLRGRRLDYGDPLSCTRFG